MTLDILLVDENASDEVVKRIGEIFDGYVRNVNTQKDAVEALNGDDYGLMIVDRNLPGLNVGELVGKMDEWNSPTIKLHVHRYCRGSVGGKIEISYEKTKDVEGLESPDLNRKEYLTFIDRARVLSSQPSCKLRG